MPIVEAKDPNAENKQETKMDQAFDELANAIKNKKERKFVNDIVLLLTENE
jgi:hypothetical protein